MLFMLRAKAVALPTEVLTKLHLCTVRPVWWRWPCGQASQPDHVIPSRNAPIGASLLGLRLLSQASVTLAHTSRLATGPYLTNAMESDHFEFEWVYAHSTHSAFEAVMFLKLTLVSHCLF